LTTDLSAQKAVEQQLLTLAKKKQSNTEKKEMNHIEAVKTLNKHVKDLESELVQVKEG